MTLKNTLSKIQQSPWMHFSFSNLLPSDVALISAGSKPSYWRLVCNLQNLVKCVEGDQDGHKSSIKHEPTNLRMYGMNNINCRINDNIFVFKCLRHVQSMDKQVHCSTGCWELRKLHFFAIVLWSWHQQNCKETKNQGWHIKRNIWGIYEKWSAERRRVQRSLFSKYKAIYFALKLN